MKIRFIIIILISSICLNNSAINFNKLKQCAQRLQSLYLRKKPTLPNTAIFKTNGSYRNSHNQKQQNYSNQRKPYLEMSAASIYAAFLDEKLQEQKKRELQKKELLKNYKIISKFINEQITIFNDFYQSDEIQITKITLKSNYGYVEFFDPSSEIYDTPEEFKIIETDKYKLTIFIQSLNDHSENVPEKEWEKVLEILKSYDGAFILITDIMNKIKEINKLQQ
ncbi:MAG: hypothetical protein P4L22_02655 [Candidatus Babeliales bacterium]|nr:hypothetical protein [Candidatus Babeliales bacterium]